MQRRRLSHRLRALPLFWRVFALNGVVFLVSVSTLAFSPATVSSPVLATELIVLVGGLTAILALNAVLLRVGLAPLERLTRAMDTADLLRPGHRLTERGSGEVTRLVGTFNAMLSRMETERAESTSRVLTAQEEERRRIARELHDEIGQSLTAVLLELRRTADRAPADLRRELAQVQETARDSLDDVRRIARRLRPDLLEDLGMSAALTALASDFSALTAVPVRRTFTGELTRLSEEVEVVVYRVVQESLTNIARHAEAREVHMSLTHDGSQLWLTVRDDGIGLHGSEGAGIRGMRERALLVGADLAVVSRPGDGTEVSLCVPHPERTA